MISEIRQGKADFFPQALRYIESAARLLQIYMRKEKAVLLLSLLLHATLNGEKES